MCDVLSAYMCSFNCCVCVCVCVFQNEASSAAEMMAADPEMERLEKQLQQSVNSLSTLLGEKKEGEEEVDGEGGGQGREDDEDSLSDGEDSHSEEDFLDKKCRPGAVNVLPPLSDQLSLLSPGSLQPPARELSPESLLEESLCSISKPILITTPASKTAQAKNTDVMSGSAPATQGGFSSIMIPGQISSATTPGGMSSLMTPRVISSTTSSPGASITPVETQRPRSKSETPPPRDKPLMIPSRLPPWIAMVRLLWVVVGELCVRDM